MKLYALRKLKSYRAIFIWHYVISEIAILNGENGGKGWRKARAHQAIMKLEAIRPSADARPAAQLKWPEEMVRKIHLVIKLAEESVAALPWRMQQLKSRAPCGHHNRINA